MHKRNRKLFVHSLLITCFLIMISLIAVAFEHTMSYIVDAADAIEYKADHVILPSEYNSDSNDSDQSESFTEYETGSEIETKVESESEAESLYSDDDLYILSHILCGECREGSELLQKAVGSVFLNRVESSLFPDTFYDVAFQEGQYECTWDGNYDKEPTETNIAVAEWLFEHGSIYPVYVIFQAEFIQGDGVYDHIGNMYFCYTNQEG